MNSRAALLLVVLFFFAGITFGASYRFNAFCNYDCPTCSDPTLFDIQPCDQTQTGGGCTLPGCGGWSQGAFPTISDDGKTMVNGGVPQAANLTYHLELLKEGLVKHIPDANYSGNAAFDFEAWTPIWEQNGGAGNWHGRRYQKYSIELVKKAHPSWSADKIEAEAKKQFTAAGINFFVESLKAVKAMRPFAKWGYYGFPLGIFGGCHIVHKSSGSECGFNNPVTGPAARAANDEIAEIWKESTAIYPSIYLVPQSSWESTKLWEFYNAMYVKGTVAEAVRLADKFSDPSTVVLPFYWAYYHNGTTQLRPADVEMCIQNSWSPPRSTGMILWGGNENIATFLNTTEGPDFKTATHLANHCSTTKCSGHGWCSTFDVTTNTTCVCDTGFSGSDCSKQN